MIMRLFISFIIFFFSILNPIYAQWTPVQYPGSGTDFPLINAMDFQSLDYGLAVSENGLIIRTQDSGLSWDTVYQDATYTFTDITFTGGGKIFAVGHKTPDSGCSFEAFQGVLLTSNNGGTNWDDTYYDFSLHTIISTSTDIAYITGSCGRVLKTTQGGGVWTELPPFGTTEHLTGASFLNDVIGFVSGGTSLFKTIDGEIFTLVNDPLNLAKDEIFFLTEELGFARNNGGTSRRTEDGGTNWTTIGANLQAMFVTNASTLYVGNTLGLLRSDNLGANYTPQVGNAPLAGTIDTRHIYFFDENTGFVAGPGSFFQYDPPQHTLSGKIFADEGNCIFDGNEPNLSDWLIKVENDNGDIIYQTSDNSGNYSLVVDTGNYTITLYSINEYWKPCTSTVLVNLTEDDGATEVLFPVQRETICEQLVVDISTHELNRCTENTYIVSYCNKGTKIADNVIVEISFDPHITVLSSEIPGTPSGNNTFQYTIGSLEEFECNSFKIETFLSCEGTVEGQTHSVEAHIFPNDFCLPPDPSWDGSSVKVDANCTEDSLILNIINSGLQNMSEDLNFIIIEDNVLLLQGNFNLDAAEDSVLVIYPNGGTIRLEAEQAFGHPGRSLPSVAVEGCGTDLSGNFSLGYVLQYPEDDADHFRSIDAHESVMLDSIESEPFKAFPKGYGTAHFIKSNQDIEYHILFQNNEDSIINEVLVTCEPSVFLDLATTVPGVSSHAFDFEIFDEGIIRFSFPDIDLAPGESGFIKFRIGQLIDNVPGTAITSLFEIDFNEQQEKISGALTLTIEDDFIPPPSSMQISGTVYTDNGLPLGEVTLNNFDTVLTMSDTEGKYLSTIPYSASQALQISAKNSYSTDGVTAYDLYLLNSYLADSVQYDAVLDLIIADADFSGVVDSADLVSIQDHILNFRNESYTLPWKFLNKEYSLNNNINSIPIFIDNYNLTIPTLLNKSDFIGLKKGDLSKDFQEEFEVQPDVLELQVIMEKQDSFILYSFNLPGESSLKLLSYQLAAAFDSENLEIENITSNTLGRFHYDINKNEGHVAVCWYADNDNLQEINAHLFTVKSKQKNHLPVNEIMELVGDGLFPEMFILEDNQETPVKLKIDLLFKTIDYENPILNIHPNPAPEELTIEYTIIEDQKIRLQLFNASGQLIRAIDEGYKAKGKHRKNMKTNDLPVGVYFIHLSGTDTKMVKKLLVF